ncbi:branched-chain amino acid ABC transporter permease [Phreatobacter aquaticus]|uniref:Branched-chain amino acid ABC transporter permease n=1 Tax=Phreatobacter aquaticus TaxID=2570229 RepID=A0A4D7QHL9_9HYPH|nr:branched-chain amino acid ABC transporter permease [Phreatobacter aquaticus]QCK86828.1 branched-chain amino acid ABC transporter permease [Phreatobacter aquaticus]
MWRLGAGLIGLCLMLAGCATTIEPDHLRICRDVLPALHPEGTALRETRQMPVEGVPFTVRIDYLAREPGRLQQVRYLVCQFAGGGNDAGRFELAALLTDAGPVSEVKRTIIQRWWLGDAAALAEASRQRQAQTIARVPMAVAYGAQQVANGLVPAALYGLLASAYALVYGLLGRINLAFGEIAVAGAYAALGMVAATSAALGLPLGLALATLLGSLTAACFGLAVARGLITPLLGASGGRSGQTVLVATIGLAVALSEGLRIIHGSSARWAPPVGSEPIPLMRAGEFVTTVTANQLAVFALASLAAISLLLVMRFSRFGRAWRAFADDPGMAALSGIDAGRLVALTFALAGAAAGLAGTAHALHFGSAHFALGTVFGLKALTAAILGGIGSLPGALLGGIALGLAETLWSGYLPIQWRDVAVFSALVLIIVIRPQGLFSPDRRPV